MTMTIAETIAKRFRDNHWCCTDAAGHQLADVCSEYAAPDQDWELEATRWTFEDLSVITASGPEWDFGYPDCFCMRGWGHTEECRRSSVTDEDDK